MRDNGVDNTIKASRTALNIWMMEILANHGSETQSLNQAHKNIENVPFP